MDTQLPSGLKSDVRISAEQILQRLRHDDWHVKVLWSNEAARVVEFFAKHETSQRSIYMMCVEMDLIDRLESLKS